MGWLGKALGGAVGFAVGGPGGAAVGLGLGAWADRRNQGEPPPALDVEAASSNDGLGQHWKFTLHGPVPRDAAAFLSLRRSNDEALAALPPIADEDGEFTLYAPVKDGVFRFYLPLGAARYRGDKEDVEVLVAVGSPSRGVIGVERFEIDIPRKLKWGQVMYVRPLVELCMLVADADGRVAPEEVRLIKRQLTKAFELKASHMNALRDGMKKWRGAKTKDVVSRVRYRFPNVKDLTLLELVAHVAHCDGDVHPAEVKAIRRISRALGVPSALWPDLRDAFELHATVPEQESRRSNSTKSRDPVAQAYAVLGLASGTSMGEVHAAYRKVIVTYHPDKVSTMAEEFQELAHRKTAELNAAYETLKAHLDG